MAQKPEAASVRAGSGGNVCRWPGSYSLLVNLARREREAGKASPRNSPFHAYQSKRPLASMAITAYDSGATVALRLTLSLPLSYLKGHTADTRNASSYTEPGLSFHLSPVPL